MRKYCGDCWRKKYQSSTLWPDDEYYQADNGNEKTGRCCYVLLAYVDWKVAISGGNLVLRPNC